MIECITAVYNIHKYPLVFTGYLIFIINLMEKSSFLSTAPTQRTCKPHTAIGGALFQSMGFNNMFQKCKKKKRKKSVFMSYLTSRVDTKDKKEKVNKFTFPSMTAAMPWRTI